MKIRSLFLLFVIALCWSVNAQTILDLSTGTQTAGTSDSAPLRSVQKITDGFIVTYTFQKVNLFPDDFYPGTYNWEYNSFGVTHDTAKPALPVRYEDFAVPEGKYATVSLVSFQYQDFSLELSPAKPLYFENTVLTNSDVPAISSYSGFYPETLVSVADTEVFRNVDIATIGISPVQYNVQTKTVRAYTELKFKILFENKITPFSQDKPGEDILELDLRYVNDAGGGIGEFIYCSDTTTHKEYLILSVPEFKDEIEKLCEWKRTLGFSMYTKYNDNWTVDSIKYAIRQFASMHPDFTHLLLFGDYSCLPSVEYHDGPNGNEVYHSDLAYACLTGRDSFNPDVLYGRIPVDNKVDANTVVEKTINYEKNPVEDADFFNTHTFVALFDYKRIGSTSSVRESESQYTKTCENIRNRLHAWGYQSNCIYRLSPYTDIYSPTQWYNQEIIPEYLKRPQYNWNGDASDISLSINTGTSMLLYRGVAEVDRWKKDRFNVDGFYSIEEIKSLYNASKQPIVFSITCHTGRLDTDKASLAEVLLNKSGGCVGIIASTNESTAINNNYIADGLFEAMWPKYYRNDPVTELGGIFKTGFSIAEHYYQRSEYQRRIYHCYGDPSLRVFKTTPKKVEGVTVTCDKSSVTVKCDKPMYISIYNPTKGTTSLIYGTRNGITFLKDLEGNVYGDPQDVIVCVYNTGYKPEIYKGFKKETLDPIVPPFLLNTCTISPDQTLLAEYDTLEDVGQAQIIVTDIYGNRKIIQECEQNSEETIVDVSFLNKGVYVVSLVVDGQLTGSKSVMK